MAKGAAGWHNVLQYKRAETPGWAVQPAVHPGRLLSHELPVADYLDESWHVGLNETC